MKHGKAWDHAGMDAMPLVLIGVNARWSCRRIQGWGNPGLEDGSPLGFGDRIVKI